MFVALISKLYKVMVTPTATVIGNFIRVQDLKANIRAERNALRDLDDAMLKDIGITREQALKEAAKDVSELPAERLSEISSTSSCNQADACLSQGIRA